MKVSLLTIKDLKGKKSADIDAYITTLQTQKAELVHQISLQKENKTHQIAVIKRAIAQAKTVQTQQGKEQ